MLEKKKEDSTKVNGELVETKVDRKLDNTMLAKCNLKLAEQISDDEERELVEHDVREAKRNLKLAERLAKYHRFYKEAADTVLLMTTFGASILG